MRGCILIVDDSEPWRRFTRSTLQKLSHLLDILEASDGRAAVRKAREAQPDLILLDIGLPNLSGMDAARQIRVVAPNSKILFLTETHDPEVAAEALRIGSRGFVFKIDAEKELLAAIGAVMAGRRFVSEKLRLLSDGYPFDFARWQAEG